MLTIAVDNPVAWASVIQSACLSVRLADCAIKDEPIEMLFGMETFGDPRNIVFDASLDLPHGFDAAFGSLLWLLVNTTCYGRAISMHFEG